MTVVARRAGPVRVYAEVARRAFARQARYRASTATGVFTNTVFGFVLAYVLLAVYAGRSEINGFAAGDAVTFTFVAQGLLVAVGVSTGGGEQAERIRSGDVVVDLYRPVDYQCYWAAMAAGHAAYHLVFRGVPIFLAGWLLFPGVRPPAGAVAAVGFLASVALAVAAAASFRFTVDCLAFWLLDVRGPRQIVVTVAGFFSGSFVPTFLFPPGLHAVSRLLPFEAMTQWPVEVFLGARTGTGLAATLAGQAVWVVALASGGRFVFDRAVRQVVVQGG